MTNGKLLFLLVDPNDDSGNDDGVLDRIEMTQDEANVRNKERRAMQSDCRWVRAVLSKSKKYYLLDDNDQNL
jgi:hypothetical protein